MSSLSPHNRRRIAIRKNYRMLLITEYTHRFSHLHTATSRTHWTIATQYKAPNKPLLLLTIIDLFAQGNIVDNLVEPTEDLGDLYTRYWSLAMPPDRRGNLAMPFFHLRSEGFWHLVPRPGQEAVLAATKTMTHKLARANPTFLSRKVLTKSMPVSLVGT